MPKMRRDLGEARDEVLRHSDIMWRIMSGGEWSRFLVSLSCADGYKREKESFLQDIGEEF